MSKILFNALLNMFHTSLKSVYLEVECVVYLFTEAIDWSGFISCQAPVVDVFSISCYSQNHDLATFELTYFKSGK